MSDHGRTPPPGEHPRFSPGDRVTFTRTTRRHGTEHTVRYPATVVDVLGWFRRAKEPWTYIIDLDRTEATRRITWTRLYPYQSQLTMLQD